MEPKAGFRLKRLWHAMLVAGLVSTLVSSVSTLLDWRLNPGGLFRTSTRTNWPIVGETWLSWALPTFAFVFVAAAGLLLLVDYLRR